MAWGVFQVFVNVMAGLVQVFKHHIKYKVFIAKTGTLMLTSIISADRIFTMGIMKLNKNVYSELFFPGDDESWGLSRWVCMETCRPPVFGKESDQSWILI